MGALSRRSTRLRTGRGGRSRQTGLYLTFIPGGAKKIQEKDAGFIEPDEFQPLRVPGPQVDLSDKSPLEIFTLFFDDQLLEHLVSSTNVYAQLKKSQKPAMYKRFQLYTLTKEEMQVLRTGG